MTLIQMEDASFFQKQRGFGDSFLETNGFLAKAHVIFKESDPRGGVLNYFVRLVSGR